MSKTNAMRLLDQLKIEYEAIEYDVSDGLLDGLSVAAKIGVSTEILCKTLVCRGQGDCLVYVIPVEKNLDLKAAAAAAGEKKIEMLPQKELKPLTGYVHGGCSPLGMKKNFSTYIDEAVIDFESIIVNGGSIGMQIKLNPQELQKILGAFFVKL